jgi:hypothetical protein
MIAGSFDARRFAKAGNGSLPFEPAKQLAMLCTILALGLGMIAKRILRERGTSSFGRLGRYILREHAADDLGATARIAGYILGREGGRAVGARFTNCLSAEPELALKEIFATQAMNRRAKGDRTYHLVIAFPPGERPSPEVLTDIEANLCDRIGLGGHQRLSAVHLDTGHLHLHVAINKVHPESFHCVEPYYDKRRLMQACIELEIKHGLTPTAHGMVAKQRRPQGPDKAASIEALKSIVRLHILAPAGPQSWEALHDLLGVHGFELRLRGAGLVFQSQDRVFRVKASVIDRNLSLNALTALLGPFQARLATPSEYSAIRRPSGLYQRYLAERAAESQSGLKRGAAQAFALVKASYERQARAILEDRSLTNAGRNAAFRAFRVRRQAAFDSLRRNWPRSPRKDASFLSWPAYVRAKAAQSDEDAVALLDRWRARSGKTRANADGLAGLGTARPKPSRVVRMAGPAATLAASAAGEPAPDYRAAAFAHPLNVRRGQATRLRSTRRAAMR